MTSPENEDVERFFTDLRDTHLSGVGVKETSYYPYLANLLNSIGKRDREVLIRFYLDEQTPDQICQAMKLTETQFRLIKSRAKARFGELGKRRFSLRTGFRP